MPSLRTGCPKGDAAHAARAPPAPRAPSSREARRAQQPKQHPRAAGPCVHPDAAGAGAAAATPCRCCLASAQGARSSFCSRSPQPPLGRGLMRVASHSPSLAVLSTAVSGPASGASKQRRGPATRDVARARALIANSTPSHQPRDWPYLSSVRISTAREVQSDMSTFGSCPPRVIESKKSPKDGRKQSVIRRRAAGQVPVSGG